MKSFDHHTYAVPSSRHAVRFGFSITFALTAGFFLVLTMLAIAADYEKLALRAADRLIASQKSG